MGRDFSGDDIDIFDPSAANRLYELPQAVGKSFGFFLRQSVRHRSQVNKNLFICGG